MADHCELKSMWDAEKKKKMKKVKERGTRCMQEGGRKLSSKLD